VFLFVGGVGLVRWQGGKLTPVLQTTATIRDLQLDAEGAVWASLSSGGIVRHTGAAQTNISQESYTHLAIRTPSDVWAINDSQGSVVHYDGANWKTMRTRASLPGAFADNHLLDVATDGRAVWVSSWNGLWRVNGARWIHVAPPHAPASPARGEDGPAIPAYPLSLVSSPHGLIACYVADCLAATDGGWRPSHWPADKAHLQCTGGSKLGAGTGADGRTIVIAHLDGSGLATSAPLPPTGINDIAIDGSDRVWVATAHNLTVMDAKGKTLQQWDGAALGGITGELQRVVVAGPGPKLQPAR
jgi:ligand-binding sensor domain-containing protein